MKRLLIFVLIVISCENKRQNDFDSLSQNDHQLKGVYSHTISLGNYSYFLFLDDNTCIKINNTNLTPEQVVRKVNSNRQNFPSLPFKFRTNGTISIDDVSHKISFEEEGFIIENGGPQAFKKVTNIDLSLEERKEIKTEAKPDPSFLLSLFVLLPEESTMGIDKEVRIEMAEAFKKEKKLFNPNQGYNYYFEIVDPVNGYLSIQGIFEGSWEMCYWNLNNKEKFVATAFTGCGPLCSTDNLDFYKVNNNKILKVEQPELMNLGQDDFFKLEKHEMDSIYKKYDIPMGLIISLPRMGKNISAYIYSEFKEPESDYYQYLKPLQKGNIIEFTFNRDDGSFVMGNPYWSEAL